MRARVAAVLLLSLASPRITEGADPDIKLEQILVRDRARFDLITPTAGHDITVYAYVANGYEPAPDMNLTCRRSASAGGPTLATATVRTGSFSGYQRKRIKIPVTGASSAGPASMWCMVDAGNFVREADETDNTKTVDFVMFSDNPTDFRVEFRNLKAWSLYNHTVDFELFNPSTRGPAQDLGYDHPQRVRWQAQCTITEMPWVRVVPANYATHQYPGGVPPDAGKTSGGQFYLHNLGQTGKPSPRDLPTPLHMVCSITTGAFMPNVPVMHAGDTLPYPDWGMPQVWFSQPVILTLPNPEARDD